MFKISICLPTKRIYEQDEVYLKECLSSIKSQSYKNFEVCVSDQSEDDSFFSILEHYANFFEIKYFKNIETIGTPSNTNSAIEMAEGEIIKILFQDDFFYSEDALESINNSFKNSDRKWLVSGCNHINQCRENGFYNFMVPRWNDKILSGVNTISSPSVLSIRSDVKERLDSNIPHLCDCEYYYSLYCNYGDPIYLDETQITNRVHNNSFGANYYSHINFKENYEREYNYCKKKYNLV